MDVWLKNEIKRTIVSLQKYAKGNHFGSTMCYYTGHLHKDILENYPGKTSKKIFKQYRELQDSGEYIFTQKKFSSHGYEYYVRRSN